MKTVQPTEVFIDGASLGNPGPAGIGAVFVDAQGKPLVELYKYLGETTNNVAEYLALLYALQEARTRRISHLRVKTDSELLAHQLNGRYKVRDGTLRLFYDLAVHAINGLAHFSIEHIDRRHNTHADRLASEAVESRFDTSVKRVEIDSSTETKGKAHALE